MTAVDYVILIGSGFLALFLGLLFGLMPLKTDLMTPAQKTWSQVASLAGIGLIVILILVGKDMASWVAIGAMVVGILIGLIPPFKKTMLERISWLKPKAEESKSRGGRNRPKRNKKKR